MRVLIFTDLHASEWSEFSRIDPKTGLNTRLLEAVGVIDRLRAEAKKRRIEFAIFCGDLFHVRGVVRVPVLQAIDSAFRRLAKVCRVVILAGNHDQADKKGEHTATSVFHRSGIRVVSSYYQEDDIGFMAYTPSAKRHEEILNDLYKAGVRHLFTHAGIHGAATGPRDYIPREEMRPAVFKKFRIVFSGHYHKPQELGKNIVYIGVPMQLYRTERHYVPNFIEYDFSTNEYQRIELDTPRFKIWTSPDDDESVAGHFVDAVCPKGWPIEKLHGHLESLGAAAVNTMARGEKNREPERRLDVDATTDPVMMLRMYSKKFHGNLELKRLVKMGRELAGL